MNPNRKLIGFLILVSMFMLSASVYSVVKVAQTAAVIDPEPVVHITTCDPSEYTDQCPKGAEVDPDVLVLDENLSIEVSGDVINTFDVAVAFDVQVSWESVSSEARFVVIDVPLTWEPGANRYDIAWAPPPSLLQVFEDAEPGSSLGRWRIVGVARPLIPDKHTPYQWDSVDTFELIAPG